MNDELNGHQALAFIAVVKAIWTIGNGILTPTMKLKRGRIDESYSVLAPSWHEQRHAVVWQT